MSNENKMMLQNDALKSYLNQIKDFPILTFEEECDLSERIKKGEEEARRKMINCNLKLVVKIARKYERFSDNLLDIVQEGNMGLIKAVSHFDHTKEVRFCTYSSYWIKQSIVRAIMMKTKTIRLPFRKEELLRRIQKEVSRFSQIYGRNPSVDEVAQALNAKRDDVAGLFEYLNAPMSLNFQLDEDSGVLMDIIEDERYEPGNNLDKEYVHEQTAEFLNSLKEREKEVLMKRFSLFDGQKHTLKMLGEEMNLSPETVRQIENRAIKKLQKQYRDYKELIYG